MDKKFGSPWHVIVGRAFAYEITYEVRRTRHPPRRWALHQLELPRALCCLLAPCSCAQTAAPATEGGGGPPWRSQREPWVWQQAPAHVHGPLPRAAPRPQLRSILYLYVGGTTGVLLWKM